MKLSHAVSDTGVMTVRVLRQLLRSVDTVITVLLMPILFLFIFRYVLGGAMELGAGTADYVLPGIILMCILSGIAYTAFRLNGDVQKGIFERFHSMPIAKSSILGGHVLSSVISNAVSVAVLILIGLLVGFRPQAGLSGWLLVSVILLCFTTAMTWMSVFFGLTAKSPEGASAFSYLLLAMAFISSSFVPVDSMPAGLAAFARYQPMTPLANSVRSLLLGQPLGASVWLALGWCAAIGAAFWALSISVYSRRAR